MHQVMIHPASYDTVRAAIDRAFNLFPQDLKDKKIVIKPNVLRGSEAAEGIVTHPAVLAAVVDKVETMGPASIVVGDNPGLFSYGANEAAFEQTGLMAAAGGHYRNIGLDAVSLPFQPDFMDTVNVSRAIVDADIVISLPKFKTHGLTVVTGAIKNSYGILPGAQKARLHRLAGNPSRFHDLVVEVFRLRIPDLFIVDAVVGMEGNGPASPELREIGLILAGDNAVAVDAVMAAMMGLDPGRLRFLRRAAEAGSGNLEHGGDPHRRQVWCPWTISSFRHWAARPSRTTRRSRTCWKAKPGSRPGRIRTAARPAAPAWSSVRPRPCPCPTICPRWTWAFA